MSPKKVDTELLGKCCIMDVVDVGKTYLIVGSEHISKIIFEVENMK